MGTLAHETSHYLDKIDQMFTGKDERIPTEIRSRMIQTIVEVGAEIILNNLKQ